MSCASGLGIYTWVGYVVVGAIFDGGMGHVVVGVGTICRVLISSNSTS